MGYLSAPSNFLAQWFHNSDSNIIGLKTICMTNGRTCFLDHRASCPAAYADIVWSHVSKAVLFFRRATRNSPYPFIVQNKTRKTVVFSVFIFIVICYFVVVTSYISCLLYFSYIILLVSLYIYIYIYIVIICIVIFLLIYFAVVQIITFIVYLFRVILLYFILCLSSILLSINYFC